MQHCPIFNYVYGTQNCINEENQQYKDENRPGCLYFTHKKFTFVPTHFNIAQLIQEKTNLRSVRTMGYTLKLQFKAGGWILCGVRMIGARQGVCAAGVYLRLLLSISTINLILP